MLSGSSAPAASRFATVRWRITSPSAAAIEVHRDKRPGLIESIYEWCMLKELGLRGLTCISQKIVVIEYKGFTREEPLRFDVLVEGMRFGRGEGGGEDSADP